MILQLKSRQSNSIVPFSHEDFSVKWKFYSFSISIMYTEGVRITRQPELFVETKLSPKATEEKNADE